MKDVFQKVFQLIIQKVEFKSKNRCFLNFEFLLLN
jgi:hypothetical protein